MSTEIIKVLDDLSQRMGVAIDWSSENVLPYAMDVCERYANYRIFDCIVGLVCYGLMIYLSVLALHKTFKGYKKGKADKKSNCFTDYYGGNSCELTSLAIITVTISTIVFVLFTYLIFLDISSLIQWIFVPEIGIIKYVKSLM